MKLSYVELKANPKTKVTDTVVDANRSTESGVFISELILFDSAIVQCHRSRN